MRNQRIFITGGTGFFGTWLLESFLYANLHLELNAKMTVLTRDAARFAKRSPHLAANPCITMVEGDVRSFASPNGEFAYVIHAATDVAAAVESPIAQYAAIVDGTRRVLELASTHGTQKFLLISSGAVYGKQPVHLSHISEDYAGAPDVLHPSAVYGEGKRVSELLCAFHAESSGLQVKIARCFAFAGPCLPLDGSFAIGNFIRDAMQGGPICIGGDGTSVRSYLYAADLAIWLWTLLFQAPSLLAFNVGSEEPINIGDLAKTVASTLDPEVQVQIAKRPVEGLVPARYVPSTERAQQILHLRQSVGLEESIRRAAEWHGFRRGRGIPR